MGSVAIFKGKLVKFLAKAGILIPARPDSERSISPTAGETAFNTDANKLEVYTGTSWSQLGAEGTLVHPTTNSTFEYGTANVGMTGTSNTVIGVNAGTLITDSSANTLIGDGAGASLVDEVYGTVAIGTNALSQLTSGDGNVAIGSDLLTSLTSGISNVIVGGGNGSGALNLTTGDLNTFINSASQNSPLTLTTGSYNTFISGRSANASTTISGAVAIGRDSYNGQATATDSNDFVLGTYNHKYILDGKFQGINIGSFGSPASGPLRFYATNDTNYVSLVGPGTVATNVTWTLPAADGTSGQVLSTDGSGNLSWSTVTPVTTAFSFLDNQVTPADITGFIVSPQLSSKYLVGVYREATSNKYETLEVLIVKKASSYELSVNGVGDNSGVSLSITSSGQIQYTSTSVAGHNANSTIYWKQQVSL